MAHQIEPTPCLRQNASFFTTDAVTGLASLGVTISHDRLAAVVDQLAEIQVHQSLIHHGGARLLSNYLFDGDVGIYQWMPGIYR